LCGSLDLSGDRTDLFNVSYDGLVRKDTVPGYAPHASRSIDPDAVRSKYVANIPSYNGQSQYYFEPLLGPKTWGSYKATLGAVIHTGHPDKKGKDYLKLLYFFDAVHEMVRKVPRMDMPGAKKILTRYHERLYENKREP